MQREQCIYGKRSKQTGLRITWKKHKHWAIYKRYTKNKEKFRTNWKKILRKNQQTWRRLFYSSQRYRKRNAETLKISQRRTSWLKKKVNAVTVSNFYKIKWHWKSSKGNKPSEINH